jgi:hypothetical protein
MAQIKRRTDDSAPFLLLLHTDRTGTDFAALAKPSKCLPICGVQHSNSPVVGRKSGLTLMTQ